MSNKISVGEIPQMLEYTTGLNMSVMVTGLSGIGKTEQARAFGHAHRGGNIIDTRVSQLDPSDSRGVPYRDGMISMWAIPSMFPNEERDGLIGLWVLDEYLDGARSVKTAFQQLILERRLGDYLVPEGWSIVALGNKREHGGVGDGLSAAQQDRFCHFEAVMDTDALRQHFIKIGVVDSVTSFIKLRPDLAHNQPDRGSNDWAYPTPRSWEKISKMIKANLPQKLRMKLYASLVGEGPASEFIAHEDLAIHMPDPDQCISKPKETRVPDNPSAMYAIAVSLARHARPENFANVLTYMSRLPAEYTTLCILDAKENLPVLVEHEAFTDWALSNPSLILGVE